MSVDGVVPFAVKVVWVERHGGEVGVADLDAGGIPVGVVGGLHAESGVCGGGGDELDDGAHGGKGPTRQFMVMKLNMRCSIRFHLLVPGG